MEKAIRTAIVDMPQPEPGLSQEEVERIVEAAIASIPDPKSGLTSDEAEKIARGVVASIPPKSSPCRIHQILRQQRNQLTECTQ